MNKREKKVLLSAPIWLTDDSHRDEAKVKPQRKEYDLKEQVSFFILKAFN